MNSKGVKNKTRSSDEEYETMAPAKKFKTNNSEDEAPNNSNNEDQNSESTGPQYSDHVKRMMKQMGYKANSGLGRFGQGRVEPIETSQQKGRRGLGLKLEELDMTALKWDKSMESPLSIPERVEWFTSSLLEQENQHIELESDALWSLLTFGPRKLNIEDEINFCEPDVLSNILLSKTAFDKLGPNDMIKARSRANPFETIKHNVFQNRAAVKMANIDALFNFMFTDPKTDDGKPLNDDGLLYFADICAGPGGFSEYVLYRKGWTAKGFGFTLKNENDFRLHEFYAGSPETFDAFYGTKNDGNIFDPENCASLKNYVMKQTKDGVHLVMADGGFSVEGQENIQEILSKQLYLCQCMVALSLLRDQGNFVVKLFDIFTPFSVGLVYLMSKCFDSICICKPNTSRPANSERYLVCKRKKSDTVAVEEHLFRVNEYLWANRNNDQNDILELVPTDLLKNDTKFFNYIFESNNLYGQLQVESLIKIAAFAKDTSLHDERQNEVKKQCLKLWHLEEKVRKAPQKVSNQTYLTNLLGAWHSQNNEPSFLDAKVRLLNFSNYKNVFYSYHDWYFVPVQKEKNSFKQMRTFFMSKGRRNVLSYNNANHSWTPVNDLHIELPPQTLIYAEVVKEFIGESKKQRQVNALHIIDAILLGGTDVRKLHLVERIKMCTKFAKALSKPLKTISEDNNHYMTVPIRSKQLYTFKEFPEFIDSLNQFSMKDGSIQRGITLPNDCDTEERNYIPEGLLFLNGTNEAFLKCFSKTNQNYYFFDKRARQSFQPSPDTIGLTTASFKNTFINRHLWKWEEDGSNLLKIPHRSSDHEEKLYRNDFEELILKQIK